jgi:hypothetical protein
MPYLNHNIPTVTCLIRNEYLFNNEKGHGEYTPADVHSVASIEKRVPLFEAYLNNGVNWTRRPITAFCWKPCAPVPLEHAMYWDCFSPYIDVQVRQRLKGLRAKLVTPSNTKECGEYMFTMDWSWENKAMLDTNFSETPEHKCAHFFKMDNGNFYAYPNNRIIWHDDAWVYEPIESNPGYKIDLTIYSVENKKNKFTDYSYFTEFSDAPIHHTEPQLNH